MPDKTHTMEIFIIREGRQAGPYSEDSVRAFLTEGTARPIDMGWSKGMPEWKPLAELLKPRAEESAAPATPQPAAVPTEETHIPATAKQMAFLKYLGAEFGENLAKERAAIAISDALETPKLQVRIRKWHDDKLRMHADLFQDEIDFRRANRTTRYLERVQTEGADVLKDVTKAHVQVLVESLDKKHPGWESEPESALWSYLLPAIGEHFPQLVQPAHRGSLKTVSAVRAGSSLSRGTGAVGGVSMPARSTATFGAMLRGVVCGMVVLGAIAIGRHYWQEYHGRGTIQSPVVSAPIAPEKKDAVTPPNPVGEAAKEPPMKLIAEAKEPSLPENLPAPAPEAALPPGLPSEPPAPAMNAEKPPAPAPPEEKPEPPAPAVPAMTLESPAAPVAATTPPPAPQRMAVKLTQNIGVMLSNGQVTLPAGTVLRYVATEGQNVRVSWNNNVFFVPLMATDVNEPVAAPIEPAANPAANPQAPGTPPAAPAMPETKPKKPSDDL